MSVLSSVFAGSDEQVTVRPPCQLNAADKLTLGRDIDTLGPGDSAWIAFKDHDHLFATTEGPPPSQDITHLECM